MDSVEKYQHYRHELQRIQSLVAAIDSTSGVIGYADLMGEDITNYDLVNQVIEDLQSLKVTMEELRELETESGVKTI